MSTEIVIMYLLTYIGCLIYSFVELVKEKKPRGPLHIIKDIMFIVVMSAFLAVPLTGAIVGIIMGGYDH